MARAPKKINYSEADLIDLFNLDRIADKQTPEMARWLAAPTAQLNVGEQYNFDRILPLAIKNIDSWNEEELKMMFISQILPIGAFVPNGRYNTYYEKTVSGVVETIPLTTKTDFMIAKGVFSKPKNPYFHFQEYKPSKPTGDSMAQLLEAFLIAQETNKNGKPLYGIEIVGANWRFVTFKDRTYCISKQFDSTDKDDLLEIIAILRHFVHILETELLDDI
ncbi:MAG: hypothetical protein RI894_747 [Bacteroidota bacterium]